MEKLLAFIMIIIMTALCVCLDHFIPYRERVEREVVYQHDTLYVSNGHTPKVQFLPESAVEPIPITRQLLSGWGFMGTANDVNGFAFVLDVNNGYEIAWLERYSQVVIGQETERHP